MEALQSSLDPSILSFFEDTATIEARLYSHESEATLLTALTEILDNVDDENLSPFDTLPDSDLLSGQKGREHSPVSTQLLYITLSDVPVCLISLWQRGKEGNLPTRFILVFKESLPRIHLDSQQRSDGEEEEDSSLTLSPGRLDSPPDNELLDWEGLPITFEQEGEDDVSVSLGELVRHMHPYCMAICVENDKGEQMLPEGGILLEVVDQGENGEPILAIPDMNLPISLQQPSENEQKCSDVAEEVFSDSSEHIVVDDEDVTVSEAPVKVAAAATPRLCLDVKDEMSVKTHKEEIKEKSPCRRKKKKDKKKKNLQHEVVEGRVLRSASVKKAPQELLKKAEKRSHNKKQNNISVTPAATTTPTSSTKPKKLNVNQTETQPETTTTAISSATSAPSSQDKVLLNASVAISQSSSPPVLSSLNPDELNQSIPEVEKLEDSSAAPSAVLSATQADHMSSDGSAAAPSPASAVSDPTPPPAPAVPEPKPKSLSLAEYRRLRQQKKPAPVEKQENYSTKWPSLPELPKELTPIPCLPDPSPRDPRRPQHQSAKKEVEEVKAAWQPRGPCAPPTPEALLVPPAYMVASSNKASSPKPQQTPEPQTVSTPKPSQSQNPAAVSSSVEKLPTECATVQPVLPSVPQSSSSPSALKPSQPVQHSKERSPAPLGDEDGVTNGPDNQPVSSKSVKLHYAETTTDAMKHDALLLLCQSLPSSSPGSPLPETQSLQAEPTPTAKPTRAKSPTQELIEAFTSEIGIEAADLTSLLEQFEETQGDSDPPSTPPHQMWKPLTPVALLGKSKAAEASKLNPSKVSRLKHGLYPWLRPAATHSCCPHRRPRNWPAWTMTIPGKRWNGQTAVFHSYKANQAATATTTQEEASSIQSTQNLTDIERTVVPLREPLDESPMGIEKSSVLETPDASPSRQDTDTGLGEWSPKRGPFGRSYRRRAASRTPSPESNSRERSGGQSRKRRSRRSPSPMSSASESDSHSSSSRSRSALHLRKDSAKYFFIMSHIINIFLPGGASCCLRGRIRSTMTQKELKERFSFFGEIEDCTLHFRDHGDNYGFVTYYNTNDAFVAIENGSKLRKSDELPFDLCFGGRRQFCKTTYADLDSSREYDPLPTRAKYDALDFDTLLKQAQQNLKR
uniref:PPARG related coactivator 1 n=1 Tax=Sphaeramia orbicularis TaxID=375764 RepID=A0A673BEX4_9TELE